MRKKEQQAAYGFLLPSLFGTTVFVLLPFLDVVRRSFYQAVGEKFIAMANYREVLTNSAFQLAVRNTAKFLGVCLPILLLISFMLAVLIYGLPSGRNWMESIFLLPMAIPVASLVMFWKILFHNEGILNQILDFFQWTGRDWLHTDTAFGVLVVTYIWKNLGYDIILWIAGLSAISKEQYEAAKVSGANGFQLFWFITVPQMKSCAVMTGILSFVNAFRAFREAYLIAGSYPHESIYMLQHLLNNWFTKLDIQKMSAASVMTGVLISILFIILERWNTKEDRK